MATGFVFHELYLWHDTQNWALIFPPGLTIQPGEHAENPETKRRLKNLIEVSGLIDHLTPIRPHPATETEILRFHTAAHLEKIRSMSASGGGDAGELTPFGTGSYCGLAVLEEMSGHRTGVEDPWGPHIAHWGQQDLQPHQCAAIDAAAALLEAIR